MANYDYNKFYEELEPQVTRVLTDVYIKYLYSEYADGDIELMSHELEPYEIEALNDVYQKHISSDNMCGNADIDFNGEVLDNLNDVDCDSLIARYKSCLKCGEYKPDDIEWMISELVSEEVPDMIDGYWFKVTGEERRTLI